MSRHPNKSQINLFEQSKIFADKRLFVDVVELTDDSKVQGLLSSLGIRYLGQAVAQERGNLIRVQNYGRKTVDKLEKALQYFDLNLEVRIPEWADLTAEDLESEFGREIDRAASWVASQKHKGSLERLEDEFDLLLSQVNHSRNREMVSRRFGLNGEEPETLQCIANDLGGLTRERVRQITDQYEKTVQKKSWRLSILDRAIDIIRQTVPCSDASLVDEMVRQGICRQPLSIKGIIAAAQVTGRKVPVQWCKHRLSGFWVPSGEIKLPSFVLSVARKEMSASGVVTFERVADKIEQGTTTRVSPEFVHNVVRAEDSFELLDENVGWFWFPTARNRLINTLKKVFAVTNRVHVSEVRLAIQRVRRLDGFAPPQRVLLKLAKILPEFDLDGSFIQRAKGISTKNWIEGTELIFATVLREHSGLLDRITLEKECQKRGMNEHTFVVYLHQSPVMLKLGRGVFGLVGTEATAGEIADHELAKSNVKAISEFGWTSDGNIQVQYRITSNMLYTGFFPLPAQICDYIVGSFDLVDEDGETLARIKTKRQVAWNLRKLFRGMGGDIGDPFSLVFDLRNMRALISFGRTD